MFNVQIEIENGWCTADTDSEVKLNVSSIHRHFVGNNFSKSSLTKGLRSKR